MRPARPEGKTMKQGCNLKKRNRPFGTASI
jgi:hypothetical protein